jgi:hypothetical protein
VAVTPNKRLAVINKERNVATKRTRVRSSGNAPAAYTPKTFRFGKLPPVVDSRTLRFGAYLEASLAPPPSSVNYGKKVASWPMFGNDTLSDCTCAAAGHMVECWTANSGKKVVPSETAVVALYRHFVPIGSDHGCDMMRMLKGWRLIGLGGDKITAYASLETGNLTEVRDAVNLFGGAYIGLALPQFADPGGNIDISTIPWVVPLGGPVGNAAPGSSGQGHCVNAVAYDARNLYVVTWGAIKPMSWQFYSAYADEAYAIVSNDFLKNGKAPNGFNLRQLMSDLGEVGDVSALRASIMSRRPT